MNIKNIKVGDLVFNRPVIKVTNKCVWINPTVPYGKSMYKKTEIVESYIKRKRFKKI